MKLGFLGGSFDPPHWGHLILASEAVHHLELDRLEWVLTPNPPHKPHREFTPVDLRLELLQAAVGGNSRFVISREDIDRPPPHYAAETMGIIRDQHPEDELIYLMGEDSLRDLPDWYRPELLIETVDGFGVMPRPDVSADLSALEGTLPGVGDKVRLFPSLTIEISSSLIRKRAAAGGPYRYFVPRAVLELIEKNQLYQQDTRAG